MSAFTAFNRHKACRYGTLLYNIHDVYIGRSLDLYGEWSEGEATLFRQVVAPGQTVLEVGANIGAHTVLLAELVGVTGQVLAFEPQRIVYQTLCANLALNSVPNVRTFHAAVGNAASEIVVPPIDYHRDNNFGGVSLEGHQRGERVPVLTIDALALAACHFIKVDVEGMEQSVMEGAAQTIARCRPLLYVENDRQEKSAALIAAIAGMGYALYWHMPPLFNAANFAGHRENVFGRIISQNMFCVPADRPMNIEGLARVEVPPIPARRAGSVSDRSPPVADAPGSPSLDAARKAHQAGDLATAVRQYEELLRSDSANAQVWYLLGAARQALGRLDESVAALREAVRLEPHRAEAHNHLGVVLAQQRHYGEAEAAFGRALELRPHAAETQYNRGLALKELGRLDEALAAFDQVLRLAPGHADARNNRGVVHRDRGDTARARTDFEQALQAQPAHTRAWANLGHLDGTFDTPQGTVAAWQARATQHPSADAFLGLGRALLQGDPGGVPRAALEQAAAAFGHAIRLQPTHAEAYGALSGAQRQLGQSADAVANARKAVQLAPESADAFHNLGVALVDLEQLVEGESALREAVRLRPEHGSHHYNLSVALRRQGRNADAAAEGRRAVELAPELPEGHNNLGLALLEENHIDDAVACFHESLRLRADFFQAHNNLGVAWWRKGRLADSEASYRKTIELKPDFAEGYNNLGNVLRDTGRFEEAEKQFTEALRLKPDYPDPHWNRALQWLLLGDFARGWPEYEYRWQLKTFQARRPTQPRWDGSPLAGRTILVHPEQGLGDTVQFVRYLPLVKAAGGTVIFECPKPLLKLLQSPASRERERPEDSGRSRSRLAWDQIVPQGSPLPPFDVHISLLSLPQIFGSGSTAPIPANVPYVHADPALVEKWRQKLSAARNPFRVAIAWQGSTAYRIDHFRSMPLACFAPLAKIPGVELISLQKGPGSEQITQVDFSVTDLGDEFDAAAGAFMDTAAIMTLVDLVITSDTVIPHLAGALGVPVWMATPWIPDWRWLMDRADSPWYPTMRLYRQAELGAWSSVFQCMASALEKRIREGKKSR